MQDAVTITTNHSGPDSPARQRVESSVIKAAGYLAANSTLDIEFHSGSIYRYHGVDDRVAAEFFTAGSIGRYYTRQIRGTYKSEKIS